MVQTNISMIIAHDRKHILKMELGKERGKNECNPRKNKNTAILGVGTHGGDCFSCKPISSSIFYV